MKTAPLTVQGWLRYPIVSGLVPAEASSILEIGCGRGALGSVLASRYRYVGLEPDAESFRAASTIVDGVLQLRDDEFEAPESFDLVCAFEVLEHIADDAQAVRSWRRFLKPGGWLLLSVPAGERRFGASDVRVGHVRRYERSAMRTLLLSNGFCEPTIVGYGFPLGNVLLVGQSLLARVEGLARPPELATAASGRWLQPGQRSALARRAIAHPFGRLQKPFARSDVSPGLIARARLA